MAGRAAAERERRLDALERLFRALADRTRLRILALLAGGEVCVCDIHGSLQVPQPTASRHLAYLRRVRLVAGRRDGLWVHYRLATPEDPVLQSVVGAVRHSLEHVPATRQDRRRLEEQTGCCVRVELAEMLGAGCCGPVRASLPRPAKKM